MTRAAVPIAAVLALAVAGCGGSDDKKAGTGGAASGNSVAVAEKSIKFVPQHLTAKVGQKITWTNEDPVAHTATARSGADFDSGTMNPGDTFSFTPKKPGKIDYYCVIHPGQTGTIDVTG